MALARFFRFLVALPRGRGDPAVVFGAFGFGLLILGCQPQIGDDCIRDLDCSQQGDRVCDTTQPDGYCTQFNCDPTSCPDEAVCVAFSNTQSTVEGCQNSGRTSPYVRNFCMKSCERDQQCRPGYTCIDLSGPNLWGADIISENPSLSSVCLLEPELEQPDDDALADVPFNVCSGGESLGGFAGAAGVGDEL